MRWLMATYVRIVLKLGPAQRGRHWIGLPLAQRFKFWFDSLQDLENLPTHMDQRPKAPCYQNGDCI